MKKSQFFLVILTNLLLIGCVPMRPATNMPSNKVVTWPIRQQGLQQITNWQLSGAVAVRTPQKAFSASVNWQQQKNSCCYTLNLLGPLGIGAVILTGNATQITLQEDNGQIYTASTPEQLLQLHLGWQLPIANLYYWVRGLPAPNAPAQMSFDSFNHVTSLQQQGWQITYLSYTGVGLYDLPNKIFMRNGPVQIRLVISTWRVQ